MKIRNWIQNLPSSLKRDFFKYVPNSMDELQNLTDEYYRGHPYRSFSGGNFGGGYWGSISTGVIPEIKTDGYYLMIDERTSNPVPKSYKMENYERKDTNTSRNIRYKYIEISTLKEDIRNKKIKRIINE